MRKGTLKQILLITDGCSNSGENPVHSAAHAFKQGISVNVIGVLSEYEDENSQNFAEINEIATAGGGVSQIVYKEELSQTVQAVTQQAMSQTLQGFVNKELANIFGEARTIAEIEPEKRGEVLEVVEELGELCDLEVLILVDTSASMHDKLPTVKEALLDLSYNLQARAGYNQFAIYQFPARRRTIGLIADWASELVAMSVIFPQLISGGITPTGPALREAIHQFGKKSLKGYVDREAFTEEG